MQITARPPKEIIDMQLRGWRNLVWGYYGRLIELYDGPQAFLVDLPEPGATVEPHFHDVDQFQVIVRGEGRFGKDRVSEFCFHYADAYTPYGPIVGPAEGISFFTLGERPTWHLLLALALTSLGVYLVIGGGRMHLELGWGQWVGIASAFLGAGAVTSIIAARMPQAASARGRRSFFESPTMTESSKKKLEGELSSTSSNVAIFALACLTRPRTGIETLGSMRQA